ncbi:hypothetical protein MAMT_01682 [Methylacidimicrobium tartarophylax]|uniref:Uncharacterized protein n=1 Tax=Methylacidimicrobium tartarophylax TaxID=1041768 RepID=A0A5E6MDN4_9BACT|nr:hypothetical protein MAMT_01682 [Methylacidimicrobium tartarophylax]
MRARLSLGGPWIQSDTGESPKRTAVSNTSRKRSRRLAARCTFSVRIFSRTTIAMQFVSPVSFSFATAKACAQISSFLSSSESASGPLVLSRVSFNSSHSRMCQRLPLRNGRNSDRPLRSIRDAKDDCSVSSTLLPSHSSAIWATVPFPFGPSNPPPGNREQKQAAVQRFDGSIGSRSGLPRFSEHGPDLAFSGRFPCILANGVL